MKKAWEAAGLLGQPGTLHGAFARPASGSVSSGWSASVTTLRGPVDAGRVVVVVVRLDEEGGRDVVDRDERVVAEAEVMVS
ncbi:hypothetical protein GCM10017788_63490 [Amycolatopsis acidiphila]|nr:hypothetical protein GCM10017788_63490 [Amycolatopsis acidiphila]